MVFKQCGNLRRKFLTNSSQTAQDFLAVHAVTSTVLLRYWRRGSKCHSQCWPRPFWVAIFCFMRFLPGLIRSVRTSAHRGLVRWDARSPVSRREPSLNSASRSREPKFRGRRRPRGCIAILPLLNLSGFKLFRDRLIGRTSAFGAEYRGSSPRPGTRIFW